MIKIWFAALILSVASCNSKTVKPESTMNDSNLEIATLGGGCFWCVEAVFQEIDGIEKVVSGFSGGDVKNPSYKQVSAGNTGHIEVAQVYFDPAKISYVEVLEIFFASHDPTSMDRQGNDAGPMYRSAIFYHSPEQKETAEKVIQALNESQVYDSPIVTEVRPFEAFYPAEDYHQDYYAENPNQPYCQFVVKPKVEKIRKVFKDKLKVNAK